MKKYELFSGLGSPGEKWQKQYHNGQYEALEFVYGEHNINPLRGVRNAYFKYKLWDSKGKIIFDVDYFSDKFGRRTVFEDKKLNIKNNKFAIFFGNEDLLGLDINSIDTMPAYFSLQMPEYKSYNYGFLGAALPYVNRIIETADFKAEVPEKNGLFIYVMNEGQYPRALEKLMQMNRSIMPQYNFENDKHKYFGFTEEVSPFLSNFENDKPKYIGTAEEVSPFLSNFKKYLGTSILVSFFNPKDITTYSGEDHRLICSLIKMAEINFLKKYPDSRFIILLHKTLPDYDHKRVLRCAKAARVEVVDAFEPEDFDKLSTDSGSGSEIRFNNKVVVNKLVAYLKSYPQISNK